MGLVGVGVATAVNLTTTNSRNVAHLGSILSNREVEKKEDLEADSVTLGEEARHEEVGMRSSRDARRQWRWRCCQRRACERDRASGRGAGRVRGVVATMKAWMA